MGTTFVTADCHFGHAGVTKFTKADGTKLRPWDDVDEMNEALVELWNSTVTPKDKVYVLGDFCLRLKYLPIAERLNGDKILIKGNHDVFRLKEYAKYFRDVRACHVLQKAILTHIPVHPDQLNRFRYNIHGHLHSNVVEQEVDVDVACCAPHNGIEMFTTTVRKLDTRYINVSVEQTQFKPVALDTILNNLP